MIHPGESLQSLDLKGRGAAGGCARAAPRYSAATSRPSCVGSALLALQRIATDKPLIGIAGEPAAVPGGRAAMADFAYPSPGADDQPRGVVVRSARRSARPSAPGCPPMLCRRPWCR